MSLSAKNRHKIPCVFLCEAAITPREHLNFLLG